MRFVTEFKEYWLGMMISDTYIPVIIEKTSDLRLKVTQVEFGKSVVFEVDEEMFEQLRLDGDQYGPYETNMYSVRIEWDTDSVSGKTILRMNGLVAGRNLPVTWEMMYEDGVWKVTDFYEREP